MVKPSTKSNKNLICNTQKPYYFNSLKYLVQNYLAWSLARCNGIESIDPDVGEMIAVKFAKSQCPNFGLSKVPLTQTPIPDISPESRAHHPQFGS